MSNCQSWGCQSKDTAKYEVIDKLASLKKQKVQKLILCEEHFKTKEIETKRRGFVLLPYGEW